jgi:hypothetical protein
VSVKLNVVPAGHITPISPFSPLNVLYPQPSGHFITNIFLSSTSGVSIGTADISELKRSIKNKNTKKFNFYPRILIEFYLLKAKKMLLKIKK